MDGTHGGQMPMAEYDFANMTLDDFNKSLAGIINGFAKKLTDAHIALIIQPTQWKAPDRKFTCGFQKHQSLSHIRYCEPERDRGSTADEADENRKRQKEWATSQGLSQTTAQRFSGLIHGPVFRPTFFDRFCNGFDRDRRSFKPSIASKEQGGGEGRQSE